MEGAMKEIKREELLVLVYARTALASGFSALCTLVLPGTHSWVDCAGTDVKHVL